MFLQKILLSLPTKTADKTEEAGHELVSFSLFEEETYLAIYPDVAQAVEQSAFSSGLQHFQLFGLAEGRFPGFAEFGWEEYLSANPDLAGFRDEPDPEAKARQHFRHAGYAEGRKTKP
ncbi:hypothetical protein ASE23_29705 [Rhizobium sp. Root73]|uniref:hypothetical protein n=1 Tax=unclassified Rhizobium TaxID=2613769 RepID=UPI00072A5674|nr:MULTISPECIES: hypothetical protein [unclassified Rhizobium]KQY06604.1 hypothetical protein ASD36_29655 [Rhizobium sp. Root1334]KRC00851.1 hypothetical protein ASE23_29705 [Rhizobium sp. Root73]